MTDIPQSANIFECIAGPDRGKRIALPVGTWILGRDPSCNLLSDDPEVAGRHLSLTFDGMHMRVDALGPSLPIVDGQPVPAAYVLPGHNVRIGGSTWQLHAAGFAAVEGVRDMFNQLGERLSAAAGVEQVEEWDAREMFSDVTRKHSDEEIEAHFTVGTATTTPPLAQVDTRWPRPWVFVRVFTLTLLLYIGFVVAWYHFENDNLIPGLIMIGSLAVPGSLLIFFFEVNVAHNVSLYQVIKLLLVGGLASIIVSLVFFEVTKLDNWLGAASAGLIEETGKLLALLLVVRQVRYRWTLNGLLLGATVGTGFAVFESAGYAMRAAYGESAEAMRQVIMERGLLSIVGGHVLWTGLVGAALWRLRGDRPFQVDMLRHWRFLRVLLICMVMHMIWNAPFEWPFHAKELALGFVAWTLVLAFIQTGLREIRVAQGKPARGT